MKSPSPPGLRRREALAGTVGALLAARLAPLRLAAAPLDARKRSEAIREFLHVNLAMTDAEIDALARGRIEAKNRKFDPVLGYISATDTTTRNSVDRTLLTYTFDPLGDRRMIACAGQPCRINTYGDSYTEGGQVSDGETWQERLAAHIGEPVRNFGVGSYSVYQAYLRMRQKEALAPASAIIFNIYSEDHFRSLKPMVSPPFPRSRHTVPLGARPYLSANAGAGTLIEHPTPCPTPESMRNLRDRDWLEKAFGKEDEIAILVIRSAVNQGASAGDYYAWAREIAARRRYGGPIGSKESLLLALDAMEQDDALFASRKVLGMARDFCAASGRRLLVVLSFAEDRVWHDLKGGRRFDQPIVDFLRAENIPFVDLLEEHRRDYASFRLSPEGYTARYYVQGPDSGAITLHAFMGGSSSKSSHPNPAGYLFQAFAIAPHLAGILTPKPPAYR